MRKTTEKPDNPNLQMGEELRVKKPSINGIAAKLKKDYPHLNRSERQQLARVLVALNLE